MFDIILFILAEEEECLKQEFVHRDLSVALDGTAQLSEAFAAVVRMVCDDWCIQQCLVWIQLLTKSICRHELHVHVARKVIDISSIPHPSNLIAVVRDGASVNGAVMCTQN